MREKKFNKGIWEFDTDDLATWISSVEEPAPLAKMCNNLHFDAEANAQLMSSAPEMLAMLEAFIAGVKRGDIIHGPFCNGTKIETLRSLVAETSAVIAKAYGETP